MPTKRTSSVAGTAAAGLRVSAVGAVQMRYAVQHLLGAATFSRRVGEIEKAHAGETFGAFFDEILHNATACVMLTVASVESLANELFADRATTFPGQSEPLLDIVITEFDRKSVLDKFDLALVLAGASQLARGRKPAQQMASLVELRNALVHFRPEFSNEKGKHQVVSKRLLEKHRSPFLKEHEALFPRAWASHALTKWAVEQAVAVDAFIAAQLKVQPKYAKFAGRLKA
jgi:hypothetical protein